MPTPQATINYADMSDDDKEEESDEVIDEFVPRASDEDSDGDEFCPIPKRPSKTQIVSKPKPKQAIVIDSEEEKDEGNRVEAASLPDLASQALPQAVPKSKKAPVAKQSKSFPVKKAPQSQGEKRRMQSNLDVMVAEDSDSDIPKAKKKRPAPKPAAKTNKQPEKVSMQ